MTRHILYVAYGADCFVQEAAYSILSLWRLPDADQYAVSVVTDRPDALAGWLGTPNRARALVLAPGQARAWQGPQAYVHRAKPQAIRWATDQIAAAGDVVLYVDSDTVFTQSPAPLMDAVLEGAVVLNEYEGGLAECRHQTRSKGKLYRASCAHEFLIHGQKRTLAPDTGMWNSGVLGFVPGQAAVLDETLALIDQMYPVVSINTIEQVALSVVLQARGIPLRDSGDVVFHYHQFKEFRQDLVQFFSRYAQASLEERLQRWTEVDPVVRFAPKRTFNALPKWQRQLRKVLGRAWQPLPYPWD